VYCPPCHPGRRHAIELDSADEWIDARNDEPSVVRDRFPHNPDIPILKLFSETSDAGNDVVVIQAAIGRCAAQSANIRDYLITIKLLAQIRSLPRRGLHGLAH